MIIVWWKVCDCAGKFSSPFLLSDSTIMHKLAGFGSYPQRIQNQQTSSSIIFHSSRDELQVQHLALVKELVFDKQILHCWLKMTSLGLTRSPIPHREYSLLPQPSDLYREFKAARRKHCTSKILNKEYIFWTWVWGGRIICTYSWYKSLLLHRSTSFNNCIFLYPQFQHWNWKYQQIFFPYLAADTQMWITSSVIQGYKIKTSHSDCLWHGVLMEE